MSAHREGDVGRLDQAGDSHARGQAQVAADSWVMAAGRASVLAKHCLRYAGLDDETLPGGRAKAFAPVQASLERRPHAEADFGRILATWRVENVRAAIRFLDTISPQ